jgi:hypothetical protein
LQDAHAIPSTWIVTLVTPGAAAVSARAGSAPITKAPMATTTDAVFSENMVFVSW